MVPSQWELGRRQLSGRLVPISLGMQLITWFRIHLCFPMPTESLSLLGWTLPCAPTSQSLLRPEVHVSAGQLPLLALPHVPSASTLAPR